MGTDDPEDPERTFAAGMEFMLMVIERRLRGDEELTREQLSRLVEEYRARARRLQADDAGPVQPSELVTR